MENGYAPFPSKILAIKKHTATEYTFTMEFHGTVRSGQFFEVSIPKYGEAPISVSGHTDHSVELTIRRVGKVTGEIFERYVGSSLYLRGPYGNGFDMEQYRGKQLIVIAGGTGLAPVRGVVHYAAAHPEEFPNATLIAGFKSPDEVLFRDDFALWKRSMKVYQTVDAAPEGYDGLVGLVTQYIPDVDIPDRDQVNVILVGPPAMMRFSAAEVLKRGIPENRLWISQERKMCCGLGKCGHCRVGARYICLDGPVFCYTEGKNLLD